MKILRVLKVLCSLLDKPSWTPYFLSYSHDASLSLLMEREVLTLNYIPCPAFLTICN